MRGLHDGVEVSRTDGPHELGGLIPLLTRRGGRDIKKMARSLLCAERKRDSAQPQLMERTGWSLTSLASECGLKRVV